MMNGGDKDACCMRMQYDVKVVAFDESRVLSQFSTTRLCPSRA
jgi:hypothetical protein